MLKKLLIFTFLLLISKFAIADIGFGVRVDCYGGSSYAYVAGTDCKTFIGIGQFRDKLKFEFGLENEILGLKFIGRGSNNIKINPYINYKNIELGFYTDYTSKYSYFTELYGFFGVDYEFIFDSEFLVNISEVKYD